ncbi:uncharacterized protein LOC122518090 [Polistes fuscatus]|uniref:uncharacterized protein LOC122518090 n=1 Tax=Polistes fuscatus TaxID=30207 RepID=UPI001CA9F374|nr:uncharacterized protein LOC122518090 [Polistes fuscatus]
MTRNNRKRGRIEEESADFVPLSKRINNLHINSLSGLQKGAPESMESEWGSSNIYCSPNYSEPSQNNSPMHDTCGSSSSSYTNEYRPDLSVTENPFYYESNKLLFSLHMERMQRSEAY